MDAREWKAARTLAVLGWDVNTVIKGVALIVRSAGRSAKIDASNADGQRELDDATRERDWERVRFLVWLKADGNLIFDGVFHQNLPTFRLLSGPQNRRVRV